MVEIGLVETQKVITAEDIEEQIQKAEYEAWVKDNVEW